MANKRMLEAAARRFVEVGKSRSGIVRARDAYRELKAALKAPEDTSDGPVDGPIESYNWRDEQ